MVDATDYDAVCEYAWHRRIDPSGAIYVQASYPGGKLGRQTTISIHRIITGAAQGMYVDHRDGNGLNNLRSNLRVCTQRENVRSFQRKRHGCTSRFRGVFWCKIRKKWRVAIIENAKGHPKRRHQVGNFDSEVEAALAYNSKAIELGFLPEALNKIGPA